MIHASKKFFGRRTKLLCLAAALGLSSSSALLAAPILNLQVQASTTGVAGTFSKTLAATPANGTTIFYQVVAQFASNGTTNANTAAKTPDGASDSIVSLPNVTLTGNTGTFASAALQNNFNTAASASQGTTGSSALTFRAAETGFVELADNPLVVDSGTYTVGAGFTGLAIAAPSTVGSGSIKIAGSLTAITNTTETTADPVVAYTALSVPEPTSLGFLALGALTLTARRRRSDTVA